MSFSYKVITNFTLTKAEMDHLMLTASKHYDNKCKAAGEQGGFIYGWKNSLWNKDDVEVEATIHQLDLVTKILELDVYTIGNFDLSLNSKFHALAQAACKESERINKEVE